MSPPSPFLVTPRICPSGSTLMAAAAEAQAFSVSSRSNPRAAPTCRIRKCGKSRFDVRLSMCHGSEI